MIDPIDILYIYVGLIMLFAGTVRIFYPDLRKKEQEYLRSGPILTWVTIVAEIILACLILCGYLRFYALIGILIMLVLGIGRILQLHFEDVLQSIPLVCIPYPTFENIVLHFTYMVIVIYLLLMSASTASGQRG